MEELKGETGVVQQATDRSFSRCFSSRKFQQFVLKAA